MTERYHIGGVPIVTKDGYLVGLITNRDLKYEENLDHPHNRADDPERETDYGVPQELTLDKAKEILHKSRKEKLPIVDEDFRLCGLITIKDIDKVQMFPQACKDSAGRLRVGARSPPVNTFGKY